MLFTRFNNTIQDLLFIKGFKMFKNKNFFELTFKIYDFLQYCFQKESKEICLYQNHKQRRFIKDLLE